MSFGSSVALSSRTQRVAVGAPWTLDGYPGQVYLFDYEFSDRSWTQLPPLSLTTSTATIDGIVYNATIGGLGSTIAISNNGERVICSAPLTSYSNGNTEIAEVGGVVLFVHEASRWSATLLPPPSLLANGHYGDKLDAGSDARFYATTSDGTGTAFVAMDNVTSWTTPAPIRLASPSDIAMLEFADASTLLSGSSAGISILKKSYWGWRRQGDVTLPDGFNSSGHVSMPENDQFMIAVSGMDGEGGLITFFRWNPERALWDNESSLRFPDGGMGHHIDFCQNRFLAAIGTTGSPQRRVVFIFRRTEGQRFVWSQTIEQPRDDRDADLHLQFATSMAWDTENCWRLAIGSVSPGYETSRVYVYQISNPLAFGPLASQYQQLGVIMAVFSAGLLIGVVVAVVAYLILRYRRRGTQPEKRESGTIL
jgi:hypothetical protein